MLWVGRSRLEWLSAARVCKKIGNSRLGLLVEFELGMMVA
jgi:hypothetical protein